MRKQGTDCCHQAVCRPVVWGSGKRPQQQLPQAVLPLQASPPRLQLAAAVGSNLWQQRRRRILLLLLLLLLVLC
jgi:hypothetical protein